MALDQETINAQLELLAAHRRTLAHLLQQAAQFAGEVFAPPQTANGIAETRAEIQHIKATLRESGVLVEDDPNDEATPQAEPIQVPRAIGDVVMGDKVAGDKVGGDKVGGDKVMGDKRSITTGGGDYAEGNIDERKGAFISGGIVYGPVVGVNEGSVTTNYTIQQRPDPALHQLRPLVGDFVGREQEIAQLVQVLTKTASGGAAAPISGVRGMGGIGKTQLAYKVAQQVQDAFPDAQLVIELRGARSGVKSNPLTPEQALQTVIHSFERDAKLPDDLSQLQSMYYDKFKDKRVLILADDAKDAAQVRQLLPPPGCALLITSRNRFSLPGMTALDLGTLPPNESKNLLLRLCPRIGKHALKLAKLCGYLPLALRVSAGVLETNDTRDVAHYLDQLEAERLRPLSDPDNPDDPEASVEASLRLSFELLEPAVQSALCQMSVFPAKFDLDAAKAVILVEGDVVEVLELLRRRSLLEWDVTTQRYNLHDLVQRFAASRLEDADTVHMRHATYYVRYLSRVLDQMQVETEQREDFLIAQELLDYLRKEEAHLDAIYSWVLKYKDNSLDHGFFSEYYEFLDNVVEFLCLQREFSEAIPYCRRILAIARKQKYLEQEMAALDAMGYSYEELEQYKRSINCYEREIEIARGQKQWKLEMAALGQIGRIYWQVYYQFQEAVQHYEQVLEIARNFDDYDGKLVALWNLGGIYKQQGDKSRAKELMEDLIVMMSNKRTVEENASLLKAFRRQFIDRRSNTSALVIRSYLGRTERITVPITRPDR